jgi:translation initiation factor 2 alpha subunit (eIF-2alpha)
MKTSVNVHQFRDAFRDCGRQDQFSHAGLGALFDYLEQLGDDLGEEIELDVIAICCDFAEYDSATEAAEEYGLEGEDVEDYTETPEDYAERIEEEALDWLRDQTTVIDGYSGTSVIIQQF